MNNDLNFLTATKLRKLLLRREVSAVELTLASLAQIDHCNPQVNAIVTRTDDIALETAAAADLILRRGSTEQVLLGLPVAHKDLALTRGVRTTFGSLAQQDHVPSESSLLVQRMHNAGAIMLGKTNTPEYGAGSHTFNKVFGATKNPYHLEKTCGGSSGGAAVALATGMVSLADGSDMGGSLRNPAAWCNVVGLRPTPGRVPVWPNDNPLATLPVEGPMARTVTDIALFMQAISAMDERSPSSKHLAPVDFSQSLERDFKDHRVSLVADYGGLLPIEPEVVSAISASEHAFSSLGVSIDSKLPDFTGADRVFKTLRAHLYASKLGATLDQNRDVYKDTLIWNIERGLELTEADIQDAELGQLRLRQNLDQFFETTDFLVLPVTQVQPFAIDCEYPIEINGEPQATYLDWMRSCFFVTVPGHPAISVPAGFDSAGLPIGLQIVGRYGDDFGVLQLAHAFTEATGFGQRKPPLCNPTPE